MTIFYSASAGGFFDTDMGAYDLPLDAVEISKARHEKLLEAQALGARIHPDASGSPVSTKDEPSVEDFKNSLCSRVDFDAEIARTKYITTGAGQALTYQAKAAEASRLTSDENPDPEKYPLLSSEIGITADTLEDVAKVVLKSNTDWLLIGAKIERARLGGKKAIASASTSVEAMAAFDAIEWP